MQIVVPMAGAGSRFADAGYTQPKPIIPVSGLPMVVRAVRDLPRAERVVFICQQAHIDEHGIDRVLAEHVPEGRIVVTPGLTEGQACTVALAEPELDPDDSVIVAACDNSHVYDRGRLLSLMADPDIDALVWTYRNDPRVVRRPQAYGYVRTRGDTADASEVSCKVPISDSPMADHAVSGFFSFRTAGVMLESITAMVEANVRVNNEFYMDTVPNVLIGRGRRVLAFEVDKYIGWGTPEELADYHRWERYFESIKRDME